MQIRCVWTYCVEWRCGSELWSKFGSESGIRLHLSRPCQNTAQYPAVQVGATRKSAKASHSISYPLTLRRDTDGWSVLRSLLQYPLIHIYAVFILKTLRKLRTYLPYFPGPLLFLHENPLSFALLSPQPPKLKNTKLKKI